MEAVKTDWINLMENILEGNKWTKIDTGMGRVECAKLVVIKEELMIVIVSTSIPKPLITRVEKLMVVEGELMVFYDGQYPEFLKEEEYDLFEYYIEEKVWNEILFSEEACNKLVANKYIDEHNVYSIQIHQNIEKYIQMDYDKEASDELNDYYSLV